MFNDLSIIFSTARDQWKYFNSIISHYYLRSHHQSVLPACYPGVQIQFAFSSPSPLSLLVRLWICSQSCASLILLESLCIPGTRKTWNISWLSKQIGQKLPMTLKLLGKPANIVGWLILLILCFFKHFSPVVPSLFPFLYLLLLLLLLFNLSEMYLAAGDYNKAIGIMGENGWTQRWVVKSVYKIVCSWWCDFAQCKAGGCKQWTE